MTHVALIACVLSVCVILPARNAFALERATIALSGPDCSQWHQAMTEALEQLEGIAQVQADAIPNHVLIDHDGRHRTQEELAALLNQLIIAHGGCRAAVMKSCITAGSSAFSAPRPSPLSK